MGKPQTLLEGLCGHALALGANAIEVEYQDGSEWVYAHKGDTSISVAHYKASSRDARELLDNLYAAAKRPVRVSLGGKLSILKVRITDRFGEDHFEVTIAAVPPLDPSVAPKFTAKQGQHLAYIHTYTKLHRQAPSEADLERYFKVSPPSVHEMIKTLERNGLIQKTPGEARSIRLLVAPEHLPPLE